jgi:threonine synthase
LPINFIVPTGAFGNAMGGFLAKKMGLPINKIVCATNANDIVHRTLSKGDMSMGENLAVSFVMMDLM